MTIAESRAAAELHWYYSTGITLFQRSTAGPMWERAEMLYARGKPGPNTMPVRETKDYRRDMVNEPLWERAGACERRFTAIALADPQAARCLAFVFGHPGAKWAAERWYNVPARGAIVAAFELVPSGVQLVERAKRFEKCGRCEHIRWAHGERVEVDATTGKRTTVRFCRHVTREKGKADVACKCGGFVEKLDVSDADRLREEVRADDITQGRDALRRQLITRATGEAEALLEHALRLWCAKGAGR